MLYKWVHLIYVSLNLNIAFLFIQLNGCTLIIMILKNYSSYHIHLWTNISLILRVQLFYHNDPAFPFLQILD
jgi:hypothetical protein